MKLHIPPVCGSLALFIIIVFLLYAINIIKAVPCQKNIISIFSSNFIHVDPMHLISNLYGIYSLTHIEKKIGTKKFIILILFLLIFTTIFEVLLHKIINSPCAIGISGILYGIATFDLMLYQKIDYQMLTAIILNISISYATNKRSSIIGHIIGVISGVIGGIIFKYLSKNFFENKKLKN
jgi:membrane associated rhomboid family serine protease